MFLLREDAGTFRAAPREVNLVDFVLPASSKSADIQGPARRSPRQAPVAFIRQPQVAEPAMVRHAVARIDTVDGLERALDEMGKRPMRRLGEALVEAGRASAAQVEAALREQSRHPGRQLGEVLVSMGVVTTEQVKSVLAGKLGIPTVDAKRFPLSEEALARIAPALCARHGILPLMTRGADLVVAMDNPLSHEALQAARFSSGCRIVPVLANAEDIREALRRRGSLALDVWKEQSLSASLEPRAPAPPSTAFASESIEFSLSGVEELASRLTHELLRHDADVADEADPVRENDSTLVKLVNKMILDAHQSGASDIHIEPGAGRSVLRVRMRRDGVLADYAELPARFRAAMVSRIKIMAGIDISERRRPQDGKIDFARFGPARLELRVATLPTSQGEESVALRLLASSVPRRLEAIGLEDRVLERLKALCQRSHGLLLVCGPTGSGKTTTLHSLIGSINSADRKIWTVEDPVEITQPGLSQVQVNPKIDLTFASALRSFLRADPDVIMVGEMRDAETATIGVEASLTGHLVLSTLHTNSAPETVSRMLDLGVDAFNLGDALLGVLSQRLARRVCESCASFHPATPEELLGLAQEYVAGTSQDAQTLASAWAAREVKLARPKGCDACGQSGYRGRLGIYEFMECTPEVAMLVRRRADVPAVRAQAMEGGMRTLKQDGILRVLEGVTTMTQVRLVAAV